MEIRDPIHGTIPILDCECPIIFGNFFQRLRNIKQLGLSEYIFPGATHTRFLHSIGVMRLGVRAFDKLFDQELGRKEVKRLKETFKLACLLHDIGHAPLSHASEFSMPPVKSLELDPFYLQATGGSKDSLPASLDRQATHEDYSIKILTDSSFTDCFSDVEREFQVERRAIADLVVGQTRDADYFMIDGMNYFPLLHQLISSELDCDRMDYLLRDSYFSGVSYGRYDLDWLIDNLEICPLEQKVYLGISEKAVVAFDDFLIARHHMFIMVYFHYRSVCLEQFLLHYFQSSPEEYRIPSDIEEYIEHDDYYLKQIMKNSKNPYAQAIIKNRIPPKIFESVNERQMQKLEKIQEFLKGENIEFVYGSSAGQLSKYYTENSTSSLYPLKVVRSLHGIDQKIYSNINEATDLFQRFSKVHAINRLYCSMDQLAKGQKKRLMELISN